MRAAVMGVEVTGTEAAAGSFLLARRGFVTESRAVRAEWDVETVADRANTYADLESVASVDDTLSDIRRNFTDRGGEVFWLVHK